MTKIGANTVTLSGTADNSYLGVIINGGTVVLGKSSSAGHALGGNTTTVNAGGLLQLGGTDTGVQFYEYATVIVNAGGAFDTAGHSDQPGFIHLSGTGISGTGALVNSASAASTLVATYVGGNVVLDADASIGVTQPAVH